MILHRKMHSNRNGSMPIVTKSNKSTPTNISESNNTKVNKTILTNSPCTIATTTTTSSAEIRTVTSAKPPTSIVINETKKSENAKSSKNVNPSTIIVASNLSSELEVSSVISPNESLSRRSMRNLKTFSALSTAVTTPPEQENKINGSPLSIDLPETSKPIKKIPKKRDFANLNLQEDETIPAIAQEVQIPITSATFEDEPIVVTSSTSKENAEQIRNMLLADWSDEDETPDHDQDKNANVTIPGEVSEVDIRSNINKKTTTSSLYSEPTMTSTPSNTNKSLNAGRIRNIPKKDRRDVILHDFSGDISMIDPVQETSNQLVVVHLDSSNSSAVEIADDQQTPTITINDDDDDNVVKEKIKDSRGNTKRKSQTNNEKLPVSRRSDLENVEPNDKYTTASILSCFDFQDDDDDDDMETPTTVASSIAHFKKKYLSSERSCQNQMTNDASSTKVKHDERAQKDRQLAAEIESLLEQTQPPPAADLLNSTNSFEESMSVKDLPIKERSKRIFKSRNRSRIEGKSSTESLTNSVTTDDSLGKDTSTDELTTATRPGKEKRESKKVDENINIKSPKMFTKTTPSEEVVGVASEDQSLQKIGENLLHNGVTEDIVDKCKEIVDNISDNASKTEETADQTINIDASTMQVLTKLASVEEVEEEIPSEEGNTTTYVSPLTEVVKCSEQDREIRENIASPQIALSGEIPIKINQISAVLQSDKEMSTANENNDNQNIENNNQISEGNDEVDDVPSDGIQDHLGKISNELEELPIMDMDKTLNIVKAEDTGESGNVVIMQSSQADAEGTEANGATEDITTVLPTALSEERVEDGVEVNNEMIKINGDKCQPPLVTRIPVETEHIPADEFTNHRMANTSPIDENSSMCASDTGAEFGSPASMLSEERLPAFPFSRNETPQQEIEAKENERKIDATKNDSCSDQLAPKLAVSCEIRVDENEAINTKKTKSYINSIEDKITSQKESNCAAKVSTNKSLENDGTKHSQKETKITNINETSKPPASAATNVKLPVNMEHIQMGKDLLLHKNKRRHIKNTPKRNIKEVFKSYVERLQMSKQTLSQDLSKNLDSSKDSSVSESHESDTAKEKRNSNNFKQLQDILVHQEASSSSQSTEIPDNFVTSDIIENSVPICGKSIDDNDQVETVDISTEKPTENYDISEVTNEHTVVSKEKVLINIADKPKESIETSMKSLRSDHDISTLQSHSTSEESLDKNETTMECVKEIVGDSNILDGKAEPIKIISSIDTTTTVNENVIPEASKALEDMETDGNQTRGDNGQKYNTNYIDADRSDHALNDNKASITNKETANTLHRRPKRRPEEHSLFTKSKQRKQQTEEKDTTSKCDSQTATAAVANTSKESNECLSSLIKHSELPSESTAKDVPVKCLKQAVENEYDKKKSASDTHDKDSDTEVSQSHSIPHPQKDNQDDIATPISQETIGVTECEMNILLAPKVICESYSSVECETLVSTNANDQSFFNEPYSTTSQIGKVEIECDTETPKDKDEVVGIESNIESSKNNDNKKHTATITPEAKEIDNTYTTSSEHYHDINSSNKNETLVVVPSTLEAESDSDKATQEFLIEFDNFVNQGTEQRVADPFAAQNIINNDIAKVQVDNKLQENKTDNSNHPSSSTANSGTVAPIGNKQLEVSNNDPSTATQKPVYRHLTSIKRRQTVCFDICENSFGGISRKRQVFDFEDGISAIANASKRTSERKMTMPDIDKYNSIRASSPFCFEKEFKTFKPRRRSSIEDNLATFLIRRPSNADPDDDGLIQDLLTDAVS